MEPHVERMFLAARYLDRHFSRDNIGKHQVLSEIKSLGEEYVKRVQNHIDATIDRLIVDWDKRIQDAVDALTDYKYYFASRKTD